MHPVFQAFLAQTGDAAAQPSPFSMVPMLVAMVAVFYFIVFRPQQKQAKELKNLVAGLKRGDEVFTQSGIIGTVVLVEDQTVTLDVGGGNKLRILKNAVGGAWKPAAPPAPKQEKK